MGNQISRIESIGRRLLIGIDPGSSTGICILDEQSREIRSLYLMDFWTTYELLQRSQPSLAPVSQVYIEQPSLVKAMYGRHTSSLANSPKSTIATRDKIVWNSAENSREGLLLRDGLRRIGFTVFDVKPVGRKKWTSEQFQAIMRYPDRSNQHVRDAAFLVHDKHWVDINADIISTANFPA